MKIALVVSDFNFDVTSLMLERARRQVEFLGAEVSHVVHVPGVYDMPLVVKQLLGRNDVDGIALIGAVIKGETKHDELIAGTERFTLMRPFKCVAPGRRAPAVDHHFVA